MESERTSDRWHLPSLEVVHAWRDPVPDVLGDGEDLLNVVHEEENQDTSQLVCYHFVSYDAVGECVQNQTLIANLWTQKILC